MHLCRGFSVDIHYPTWNKQSQPEDSNSKGSQHRTKGARAEFKLLPLSSKAVGLFFISKGTWIRILRHLKIDHAGWAQRVRSVFLVGHRGPNCPDLWEHHKKWSLNHGLWLPRANSQFFLPEGIGSYFSEESFGKMRFIWNPKELSWLFLAFLGYPELTLYDIEILCQASTFIIFLSGMPLWISGKSNPFEVFCWLGYVFIHLSFCLAKSIKVSDTDTMGSVCFQVEETCKQSQCSNCSRDAHVSEVPPKVVLGRQQLI